MSIVLTRNMMAAALLAASCHGVHAQTVVPTDSNSSCKVSAIELADWFASGSIAANGIVDPADSVAFPDIPNCSFYKWSAQMFLWLTSPAPSKYGQGTHVFNSQVFYNVSPLDSNNERTLTPNAPGRLILSPLIPQRGPAGRPVIFDKAGKMFTVVRPERSPSGRPIVRDKSGVGIEIHGTQVGAGGKPILLDKAGKAIDAQVLKNGAPRLLDRVGKPIDFRLNKTVIGGKTFFLDAAGNLIETEQGQADGTVLMANGNRLVYYALQVNDVFAYFLTGTKGGGLAGPPARFPTTVADMNAIKAFGLAHGKTFPDLVALAVELKSSWVEVTPGLDASKYVTTSATIPTYDTSNPMQWVQNGTKQAQLAMTAMHVVGSTQGHPEMIWGTFEHVDNTRNAAYSYTSTSGLKNVVQDNAGTWMFSATPPTATPNQQLITAGTNTIDASTAAGVVPSDTLRVHAWGTAPASGAFTGNNSDLIAMNSSVITQLAAGDVRKNYIMTGTTWTIGGAPPSGGNQVGTNKMANSTMETTMPTSNCFTCHTGSNMLGSPGGGGLSHIWGPLKKLF